MSSMGGPPTCGCSMRLVPSRRQETPGPVEGSVVMNRPLRPRIETAMDHRPWKIAISAVLALACALAPVSHAQAPDAPPPTDAAPPTEAPPDTSTPEGRSSKGISVTKPSRRRSKLCWLSPRRSGRIKI